MLYFTLVRKHVLNKPLIIIIINEHHLSSSENKARKTFRPTRELNL